MLAELQFVVEAFELRGQVGVYVNLAITAARDVGEVRVFNLLDVLEYEISFLSVDESYDRIFLLSSQTVHRMKIFFLRVDIDFL